MLRIFLALCLATALSACYGGQDKPDRILYPDGKVVPIDEQSYQAVPVKGPVATAEERAACTAVGGDIVRDGLAGYDRCRQYFSDAGKSCTDSTDCLGRCDVPPNTSVDLDQPVTGQCTANDSPFGCYQSVTDGSAAPPICVD